MTHRREIYKCLVCGIVAEALEGGAGEPVCCGQPMRLLRPGGPADPRGQEHAPAFEWLGGSVRVRIGRDGHPMDARHAIQWILVESGGRSCRTWFDPGQEPVGEFAAPAGGKVTATAFCSVHGLWRSEAMAPDLR